MIKNTRERRAKKRTEAEARQVVYDRLTLDEKLTRTKPGTRQYKRIMAKKAENSPMKDEYDFSKGVPRNPSKG